MFSSVEHGYSKADKINMMNAPKVLDELLDKYNDHAVNADPLRAKLEFDPLTMLTRANRYNENHNDKLLMPEDDNDPNIGDITKYQNNIRSVINNGDTNVKGNTARPSADILYEQLSRGWWQKAL